MAGLFDSNNRIFVFLGRIGDLLVLNALWLLCCIPIITAGASSAALYYCTLKIQSKKDTYVWKMFFHSFKENFRQGIQLTLLALVVGAVLIGDIYICFIMHTSWSMLLVGMLFIIMLLFLMTASFVFPYLAQFKNTTIDIIKNSFVLVIRHLPIALLVTFLHILPILLPLVSINFSLYAFSFWLFVGFAFTARINSKFFESIFVKYMV